MEFIEFLIICLRLSHISRFSGSRKVALRVGNCLRFSLPHFKEGHIGELLAQACRGLFYISITGVPEMYFVLGFWHTETLWRSPPPLWVRPVCWLPQAARRNLQQLPHPRGGCQVVIGVALGDCGPTTRIRLKGVSRGIGLLRWFHK
jgi:hypothetical protein